MLTQTDESGTTVRTFDSLNRTTSKYVPGIGLTRYLYDVTSGAPIAIPAGHIGETVTDPMGNVTTKVFDRAGRLHQVRSGNDTTTYTYFANGNRQSKTYPNFVRAEYTYDPNGRLHTMANRRVDNTILSSFNYAYDGNGNVLTKLELKGQTSYVYDALSRITQVTEPCGAVMQYSFDSAGNRVEKTLTAGGTTTVTQYEFNAQARLTRSVKTSEEKTETTDFHYDHNGAQISTTPRQAASPSAIHS